LDLALERGRTFFSSHSYIDIEYLRWVSKCFSRVPHIQHPAQWVLITVWCMSCKTFDGIREVGLNNLCSHLTWTLPPAALLTVAYWPFFSRLDIARISTLINVRIIFMLCELLLTTLDRGFLHYTMGLVFDSQSYLVLSS